MLAIPDADTFELLPWGDPKAPEARVFCDIHNLDGTPFGGDPRQVLRRHVQACPRARAHVLRRPRHRVLLLRPATGRAAAGAARRGRLLRPHHERHHRLAAQADDPHAGGDGHPRRVQLPRGRAEPAGDRPAAHRRADDGRQRDDVPARREGGRRRPGRARHVHAQAARGRAGLGHARRTCRCSRATATPSSTPTTTTSLSPLAKSFMAGLLRHAAEITAVTNQTVNSYKRLVPGLRGAGPRVVGAQQPQRADPGADRRSAATRSPPASSTAHPTRRCNPYLAFSVMLAAGMRGIERGLRAARRGGCQPVRDRRRGARQARHRAPPAVARPMHCGRWRAPSSCTTRSASTSSSGSCATSAVSGGTTRPTSRCSRSIATCGRCDGDAADARRRR